MNLFLLVSALCGIVLTVLRPRPVIASFKKPVTRSAWLLMPVALGTIAIFSLLLFLAFPSVTPPKTESLWPALLLHACFPAVYEEILFRAMIMGSVSSQSRWLGLLCSSLLFACVHPIGPQALYALCCGAILGYVMLLTKSIWCVIPVHAVNNAAAILFQNNKTATVITHVSFIVIGLFTLVIYIRLSRRKINADR